MPEIERLDKMWEAGLKLRAIFRKYHGKKFFWRKEKQLSSSVIHSQTFQCSLSKEPVESGYVRVTAASGSAHLLPNVK